MHVFSQRFVKTAAIVISITLFTVLILGSPSVAWATLEPDQSSPTEEEIAEALADGRIKTLDSEGELLSSDSLSSSFSLQSLAVESPVAISTYEGATMFETAIAEAKAAFPSGSSQIILAGQGIAWVDALSAAGLAGALNCPILFTEQANLYSSTKQTILDLGADSVIIVGGESAISSAVLIELQNMGITTERLGGLDCYDTQLKIFNYGYERNLWSKETIYFATGGHFGDALSVSPVAFANKAPLFLVNGDTGDLRSEQREVLKQVAAEGYGKSNVVIGGKAAVSDLVVGTADFVSTVAGGSAQTLRLQGATQFETSAAVATWAVSNQGFSWNNAAFATGSAPYDALAGSVLQGVNRSVLLLASDGGSPTISTLGQHSSEVHSVRFFGGEAALDMNTRMHVAEVLDIPFAALPGFKVYIDAGHGQDGVTIGTYDPGAIANGYEEATVNKELANMVGEILVREYGVDVYINDDGGQYWLRHAEAVALGCDAIVSIHFNAFNRQATGTESLIHSYNASDLSYLWQQNIHSPLVEGVGLFDRGMKQQEVAILGGPLPATLLEICFIDNFSDISQYNARKAEVARKIAEGIVS